MTQFEITYKLNNNPPSITCLVCNMTSHNFNDIVYMYCGNCHAYHPIKKDEEGNIIPDVNLKKSK